MGEETKWGEGRGKHFTLQTDAILSLCATLLRLDSGGKNCSSIPAPVQLTMPNLLGKSNLTHLWILFEVLVSINGKMQLQRK